MGRSLLFGDSFKRLMLLLAVLSMSSAGVSLFAQKCQHTFGGDVNSLIGTDFDWDEDKNDIKGIPYSNTWSVENTQVSTLGGIHVLPDGSAMQSRVPAGMIWDKDDRDVTSTTNTGRYNAYFVTDSLEKLYGKNPYSIVPLGSNGNGFYVLHNLQSSASGGLNYGFPYQDFKGRDVVLEIKFYLGNKGMTPEDISTNASVPGSPYGGLIPSHRRKGNTSANEPQHILFARQKDGFTDPASTNKHYGDFRFQNFGNPWDDAKNVYFTPLTNIARSSVGTKQVKYPAHASGVQMPYGYVYGCDEKTIYVHECQGKIEFGVGSSNGCLTASQVEYLGDPDYGFYPDGENSKSGWCYGNPSNDQEITRLSNGYWYGWYKMQVRFYIPDYNTKADAFTCFYSYMNTYLLSEHDFIAYDYINFKTAHICADNDKYCPNQPITLNAFNYADNVMLEWQQMVAFIMDDYSKTTYPATYNSLIGQNRKVWKTVNDKGREVYQKVAHGDTVIVKGYGDSKDVEGWYTFENSTARTVQVIPSRDVYENSYSLAFRAVDKNAERQESFEVWLRPDLNCFSNVGTNVKGSELVCMNDTPEYSATMGDGSDIDKAINTKWFLEYVGKEDDAALNAKLNGLLTDGYHSTTVRFDYNQLEEGVYRLGYTQSAAFYEYDPKYPNDPTHATVVDKPLNDGEPVVTYIRAFRSPNGTATLVSGMTQNGGNYQVCASDISNSVVVKLQDNPHYLHNADDYNAMATKQGLPEYEKYPEFWVRYFPYDGQTVKTTDGKILDPNNPNDFVIVPAGRYGVSDPVEVSQQISGLCDAKYFKIGADAKIIVINDKGVLKQWGTNEQWEAMYSEAYCKSSLGKIEAEVKKPDMKLICDNISAQYREFTAGPTTKDTIITLSENSIPKPSGDVCDTDPTVQIKFKDAEGNSTLIDYKYSQIKAGKAKIQLVLGNNTVHYTFVDGCGSSAECDVIYEFKDVTPPNLDCDNIIGHVISVRLSDFVNDSIGDGKINITIDGQYIKGEAIPDKMVVANKDLKCAVSFQNYSKYLHNTPGVEGKYKNLCLTDINGVDGEICPTYAGRWTTDINLFEENINDHINKFKTSIGIWGTPYEVGHTYVLWKYTDSFGNSSYCFQLIEVIDDLPPVLEGCVTTSRKIGTELDKCELSYDALLDSIKTEIPTAKEQCVDSKTLNLKYEYWIIPDDGVAYQFTSASAPLTPGTYMLQIRVYKAEGTYADQSVYATCEREIEVVDKQNPTFDCDYLTTVSVDVNKDVRTDPAHYFNKYIFDYASTNAGILNKPSASKTNPFPGMGGFPTPGNDVPNGPGLEATLENIFKKGAEHYDPSLVIAKVKDNCDGKVDVTMTLKRTKPNLKEEYDETDYTGKTGEELLEIIRKTQFYPGVNYIIYTFTDKTGNKTVCEQEVIVASISTFDPDCKDDLYPDSLFVDENCKYTIDKNFLYALQPGKSKFTYDMVNYYGMTCGPRPQNPEPQTVEKTDAYPDSLIIVDAAGNRFEFINSNSQNAKYYTEVDVTCSGMGPNMTQTGVPRPSSEFNYTNKPFNPEDFGAVTLAKGKATLIWKFVSNKKGSTDAQDIQLGYCYASIEIADKTAPTLDCSVITDVNKTALDYPQCVLPFNQSGVKMPKINELTPTDNCTKSVDDFVLTWKRSDEASEFETDFAIGTTTIDYYVTDLDGNSAFCHQEVVVTDNTVYFDCDRLKTPIEAIASADCDVPFAEVSDLGLPTSLTTMDCSDTDPIVGVPSRSDGKNLESSYPKGATTVTWTFTDKLGNEAVCTQIIDVKDKTAPDFDCKNIPSTLDYLTTRNDECAPALTDVEKLFGTYEATDNCESTKIVGEPWLITGPLDTDRQPMPSTFALNQTYIIGWVFADASGNEKVCRQSLNIKDNVAPVPTDCPDPVHITPATEVCEMTWSDLRSQLSAPTITEDCDGPITASKIRIEAWYGGEYVNYLPDQIKVAPNTVKFAASLKPHKIHWIFVDNAGNESECVQELYIEDIVAPVVDCDPNKVFGENSTYLFTVSDDNKDCELSAVDFNKLFYPPFAYDECEDLANGTNKAPLPVKSVTRTYYPTVEDYVAQTNGNPIVNTTTGEADMDANYKKGITELVYQFEDASGNLSATCKLKVEVVDRTAPYFDCNDIQPDTLRPVATTLDCAVALEDIVAGPYYAYDWCNVDDSGAPVAIPGKLHFGMTLSSVIPDTFKFKVGETYDLFWIFVDEDLNKRICSQVLESQSNLALDLDCEKYKNYESLATENECFAPFDSLKIKKMPFAIDLCMPLDTVWGVPTRSDGLDVKDNYPTGVTTITWTFKSKYNVNEAVTCESKVTIYGNKPFGDIDCKTLFPAIKETTPDCGPKEIELISKMVLDPCYDDVEAWAVPSIKNESKKYTDIAKTGEKYLHDFALGLDTVRWTFSDITDTVHAYCYQPIEVLTTLPMNGDCPADKGDIHLELATGQCEAIPAAAQLDSLKEGMWNKFNPCIKDDQNQPIKIKGVPTRSDGKALNDPYRFSTTIVWTFVDTTKTMKDSVTTCETKVLVGDVDELINCDRDFPAINEVLSGVCTYDYANVSNIPFPNDPCSGTPAVVAMEYYKNDNKTPENVYKGKDAIEGFLKTNSFLPGNYRFHWEYEFSDKENNKSVVPCDQTMIIKSDKKPLVDCDTIPDEEIVLPTEACEIKKEQVLEKIKNPTAKDACTGDVIKGEPRLKTSDGINEVLTDLPSEFKVGEPYTIVWIFKNDSLSTESATCEIELTIKSSAKPIFKCEFADMREISAEGECEIELDDQILPIPVAKDSCTGTDVYGKGYEVDTVAGKPVFTLLASYDGTAAKFEKTYLSVGVHKIAWVFESKYSVATETCVETLDVLTNKTMILSCAPDKHSNPTSDDQCSASLTLDPPTATNPCTNATIVPDTVIRSDNKKFLGTNDVFYVGRTKVYWIFVDHSKTLQDSIDTCEQIIQIGDVKEDPIQCPENKKVTLPVGVCEISPADLGIDPMKPEFRDPCADTLVPVVNVYRTSGMPLNANFYLGTDTLVREYIYHGEKIECKQEFIIRNAAIDEFDCSLLGDYNTITIELKTALDYATFEEVIAKGFKFPVLIHNECGNLDTTYTRSDGKSLYDTYPLGETTIVFEVKDITKGAEMTKVCQRVINVVNTAAPSMECPPLTDMTYVCHKDLPEKYNTVAEFLAAGGKFTAMETDASALVDPTSFSVDSVIYDVDNTIVRSVELCEFTMVRTYSAVDLRGQRITPCSQTFKVKDNVPPTWVATASVDETIECSTELDLSINVHAVDGCWNFDYTTASEFKNDASAKNGIFYTDSSTRSSDPMKCEYYNYDKIRRYVAYDACGNHSDTVKFTRKVRNTIPPRFDLEQQFMKDWMDKKIVADYGRPCIFMVPDIDSMLPKNAVVDDCKEKSVLTFNHVQDPPKGTILNTNDGYFNVKIVVSDLCGLKDSLYKRIEVPTRNSIVDISMNDVTICAEDRIMLNNPIISQFEGQIWSENWFTNEWEYIKTTSVVYDFYRDTIAAENIVFSDNMNTYGWMFNPDDLNNLTLNSFDKTGKYYIVVTDTVRYCRDTASAFITVHEAPSISLLPEIYSVCDGDSLRLVSEEISLFDRFKVDTLEMGETITESGWMVDGVKYDPNSLLSYSENMKVLQYYATNACGTSISKTNGYIEMMPRMKPENLMLVTEPKDKPRVFAGESANLQLLTKYRPYEYKWYKVSQDFDGRYGETFDRYGEIKEEYKGMIDEEDELLMTTTLNNNDYDRLELTSLQDTASYYVLMVDSVCPAVPSNVVSINVVKEIPTAFTPMNSIDMNDVFMEGYSVVIFNRYGQKMTESDNGWDGKCRGELVDPGVYFYELILKNGVKHKGTIEVVYFK